MPSVRIKKYPKTTGITATGSCGHEYAHRFQLPYGFIGTVRNEKNDKAVEKEKEFQLGITKKNPCPECYATAGLAQTMKESEALFKEYNLDPFIPLKGTIRMQSFAESLRLDWWHERVRYVNSLAYTTAKESKMGLKLTAENLIESYPQPEGREKYSEDIMQLSKALEHMGYSAAMLSTPEEQAWSLASWLLVRYMTTHNLFFLYENDRSLDWVKMHKTRYNGSQDTRSSMPGPNIIFAAALVSLIPGWLDRYEAETVFKGLIETPYEDTMKMIKGRKGEPLSTVFEEAAVYNLLAGNKEKEYIF